MATSVDLTCGFFNSNNGDRVYSAKDFSQIFDGIINDGVFESVGEKFAVTATSGMNIKVGSGRAWFDGTWSLCNGDVILTVTAAHNTLYRCDAVVLEVNETNRKNQIKIVKGTAGETYAVPAMTDNAAVHQHPLAWIKLPPRTATLTASNIEIAVGKSSCPFVTGILATTDVDVLFAKWDADFNEWFANLQTQLSGDVAGNLQEQITNLSRRIPIKASAVAVKAGVDDQNYVTPKALADVTGYKVGDILTTARTGDVTGWLPTDGRVCLKDDYPELYPTLREIGVEAINAPTSVEIDGTTYTIENIFGNSIYDSDEETLLCGFYTGSNSVYGLIKFNVGTGAVVSATLLDVEIMITNGNDGICLAKNDNAIVAAWAEYRSGSTSYDHVSYCVSTDNGVSWSSVYRSTEAVSGDSLEYLFWSPNDNRFVAISRFVGTFLDGEMLYNQYGVLINPSNWSCSVISIDDFPTNASFNYSPTETELFGSTGSGKYYCEQCPPKWCVTKSGIVIRADLLLGYNYSSGASKPFTRVREDSGLATFSGFISKQGISTENQRSDKYTAGYEILSGVGVYMTNQDLWHDTKTDRVYAFTYGTKGFKSRLVNTDGTISYPNNQRDNNWPADTPTALRNAAIWEASLSAGHPLTDYSHPHGAIRYTGTRLTFAVSSGVYLFDWVGATLRYLGYIRIVKGANNSLDVLSSEHQDRAYRGIQIIAPCRSNSYSYNYYNGVAWLVGNALPDTHQSDPDGLQSYIKAQKDETYIPKSPVIGGTEVDVNTIYNAYPTLSAEDPLNISDGADGIPVKSLVGVYSPRQWGSGTPDLDNNRLFWEPTRMVFTIAHNKNLFDASLLNPGTNVTLTIENGGPHMVTNTEKVYAAASTGSVAYLFISDRTYTISFDAVINSGSNISGSSPRVCIMNNNTGQTTGYGKTFKESGHYSFTFTYSGIYSPRLGFYATWGVAATADIEFRNVQIELGSQETSYVPFEGFSKTVRYPDGAGTVYGGRLDPTAGQLIVTHTMIELDGVTPGKMLDFTSSAATGSKGYNYGIGSGGVLGNNVKRPASTSDAGPIYSNCIPTVPFTTLYYSDVWGVAIHQTSSVFIRLCAPTSATGWDTLANANEQIAALKAAGKPIRIVWEYATPLVYTFDPIEIPTNLGENHICANTGSNVELIYRADPVLYVDRKMAELQALVLENGG